MMGSYNEAVGQRLRTIRRQKRWSLQDVEAMSGQEFKASVLGAYERGERSLSLPRLQRLARFYGVPVDQLLPSATAGYGGDPNDDGAITLDLNKIDKAPNADLISKFLAAIQVMRQDFNGRVLTIRRSDLRLLANLMDSTEADLSEMLAAAGE
jgi:transcriptional regulator with XRE-family HTH domain